MKRRHPPSIAFFMIGLFLIFSLALAGCTGSTPVDAPTATFVPSTRVLDPPATDGLTQTAGTAGPTAPLVPVVMIGGVSFNIELAETPERRTQGLSGRDSLAKGTGMLFIHDDERRYTFWMKDMRFPLDMIWIDARCTVADISAQVPPPEPGQSDRSLRLISPNVPVLHVLEINAGAAAGEGISIGDPVRFAGTLEGRFGC